MLNMLWALHTGSLRIPGVLQRIALVYCAAGLLTLYTSTRARLLWTTALVLGYWLLMRYVPVPGYGTPGVDVPVLHVDGNLAAYLDRKLMGSHLWQVTRDPEGFLSTIPAIATALCGVVTGEWLRSDRGPQAKARGMLVYGFLGILAGEIWNHWFPINKNLWTSSYVVFTAGLAGVTLATCMWLIDIHGVRWWTKPLVWFGVNPLTAFVASGFFSRLIYTLIRVPSEGKLVSAQSALYKTAFASWLAPQNASLLFALCYVLLFLWLMWELYRRDILIKL
jgi:predicted acyltransferase